MVFSLWFECLLFVYFEWYQEEQQEGFIFMVQKDTAGIPKGRMEGVILDCTDHCQLIHVELTEFGQEREMIPAAATALGLIPCVFSLAESLGFATAENSVSDNLPWLLGESLGVLSGIAAR